MKVLLDECLNGRFARYLPGLEVKTVGKMGWKGGKNGALLALAKMPFDVFLTVDRGLKFQQRADKFSIAIVVIGSRTNRIRDVIPFAQAVLERIHSAPKGQVSVIDKPDG